MAKRAGKKRKISAKNCGSVKSYLKKAKRAVKSKKGLFDKVLKFIGL